MMTTQIERTAVKTIAKQCLGSLGPMEKKSDNELMP